MYLAVTETRSINTNYVIGPCWEVLSFFIEKFSMQMEIKVTRVTMLSNIHWATYAAANMERYRWE